MIYLEKKPEGEGRGTRKKEGKKGEQAWRNESEARMIRNKTIGRSRVSPKINPDTALSKTKSARWRNTSRSKCIVGEMETKRKISLGTADGYQGERDMSWHARARIAPDLPSCLTAADVHTNIADTTAKGERRSFIIYFEPISPSMSSQQPQGQPIPP